MKKVLIVGATGTIGGAVRQTLLVDCKINPNAVRTKKISFL
ncbi:putative oxidoreductase (putative) [Lactiplantibacillus plantarum]|nr:putative oxidoreductase (putative) [Lactiplantibacillus plantarum]MCG0909047.1 putative oxidoreductase (putative) [Lactiplantibacillus plantarum]